MQQSSKAEHPQVIPGEVKVDILREIRNTVGVQGRIHYKYQTQQITASCWFIEHNLQLACRLCWFASLVCIATTFLCDIAKYFMFDCLALYGEQAPLGLQAEPLRVASHLDSGYLCEEGEQWEDHECRTRTWREILRSRRL